ncbi:MAG: hypothetical protein Q9200_007819 [Gallowayella weberi]
MHLPTRTKSFLTILTHQEYPPTTALGGRSMGARAAIMAATPETTHLILISYPLHTAQSTTTREQILLDIHPSTHVLFVSGDRDTMCHLPHLESVRAKMRCPTWRIVVSGADHGMDIRPRKHTETIGVKTGEIIAEWLQGHGKNNNSGREARISCSEDGEVQWTGWTAGNTIPKSKTKPPTTTPPQKRKKPTPKRKITTDPQPQAKKRKAAHAKNTSVDGKAAGIATRTRSARKAT